MHIEIFLGFLFYKNCYGNVEDENIYGTSR